jgi:hypothetical protein
MTGMRNGFFMLTNISSRPMAAGHDRPLYSKQFCDIEFICVPFAVIERTVNFVR